MYMCMYMCICVCICVYVCICICVCIGKKTPIKKLTLTLVSVAWWQRWFSSSSSWTWWQVVPSEFTCRRLRAGRRTRPATTGELRRLVPCVACVRIGGPLTHTLPNTTQASWVSYSTSPCSTRQDEGVNSGRAAGFRGMDTCCCLNCCYLRSTWRRGRASPVTSPPLGCGWQHNSGDLSTQRLLSTLI